MQNQGTFLCFQKRAVEAPPSPPLVARLEKTMGLNSIKKKFLVIVLSESAQVRIRFLPFYDRKAKKLTTEIPTTLRTQFDSNFALDQKTW